MLGERLRKLREDNGFTRIELANKLKVDRGTYSKWERNITKPNFEYRNTMADLYNIDIEYLFEGQEDCNDISIISKFLNQLVERNLVEDVNNIPEEIEKSIINIAKAELIYRRLKSNN